MCSRRRSKEAPRACACKHTHTYAHTPRSRHRHTNSIWHFATNAEHTHTHSVPSHTDGPCAPVMKLCVLHSRSTTEPITQRLQQRTALPLQLLFSLTLLLFHFSRLLFFLPSLPPFRALIRNQQGQLDLKEKKKEKK